MNTTTATAYFVRPTTHYMNLLEKIVEAYEVP